MSFGVDAVYGDQFSLTRTDPRHFPGPNESAQDAGGRSFNQMLVEGLNDVSALQQEHQNLAVQAVIRPDEVDAHDVTIAAAKATTALSLTKGIVDRVIQAYRDITNVR